MTIASIEYVAIGGDTYVYLEAEDGTILRQKFADNESLISLRIGDKIKVNAQQSETGTYYINTISK